MSESLAVFECSRHGLMLTGAFKHTDSWYCQRCFDANPDAAYHKVKRMSYVPADSSLLAWLESDEAVEVAHQFLPDLPMCEGLLAALHAAAFRNHEREGTP